MYPKDTGKPPYPKSVMVDYMMFLFYMQPLHFFNMAGFKKDRKDIKEDVVEDIKIFAEEINSKVIIKFLNFYAL